MLTIGLCCALLGGLLLGRLVPLAPGVLVAGSVLAGLAAAWGWRRPRWRSLALAGCALSLGALRGSLATPHPGQDPLAGYVGLAISLRGTVVAPPSSGPRAVRVVLGAEAVAPAGQAPRQPTQAQVSVVDQPDGPLASVALGDRVEVQGTLSGPVGRAPPVILFPRRVTVQPSGAARGMLGLRAAAQRAIMAELPSPQAGLAAGVLLGGSSGLDPQLRAQLQRTGLAHLLAVDGYKQVLVAALLRALGQRLLGGGRRVSLLVLPALAAYTLLAGARPSAVRAGLMLGLAELASASGRLSDPLTSIGLVASAMAVHEPDVLLDAGFQLSVSATLGLVLFWPRLQRLTRGLLRPLAEPAGMSLIVSVATLPVTLHTFGSVSLVTPLAHVVALPLVAPALLGAGLLALVGGLAPASGLAWLAGRLAWLPSTLLLEVVRGLASLPAAALSTGRLGVPAALVLAAVLLLWGVSDLPELDILRARLAAAQLSRSLRAAGAIVLASLLALAAVLLVRPDGRLHVQRLEAGAGQAIFVRSPSGQTLLIVAGRVDGYALTEALADALAVWEHGVARLLILDSQAGSRLDPVLARYSAAQVLEPAATRETRLDLGGGALLSLGSAASAPAGEPPAVAVSFGQAWLPLIGGQAPTAANTVAADDEVVLDGLSRSGQP